MKTLDITIDFETTALCPTAAVISVGAVAWNRDGADTPFLNGTEFYRHVDLRSSFLDGFTFDAKTAEWWSKQSSEAKAALLECDDEPLVPLEEVINQLCLWMKDMKSLHDADDIYLWSQGSDFDIAILRHICATYGINIPIKYTNFRDHRTFFLEGAHTICKAVGEEFDNKRAYSMVDEYDGKGQPHNPIYDCKRSIYSAWQMMHMLTPLNRMNK